MNNYERKLFLISIILEMPDKYIERVTKLAEYLWIYKNEDDEEGDAGHE